MLISPFPCLALPPLACGARVRYRNAKSRPVYSGKTDVFIGSLVAAAASQDPPHHRERYPPSLECSAHVSRRPPPRDAAFSWPDGSKSLRNWRTDDGRYVATA